MEDDQLIQARKEQVISFLRKDKLTAGFIILGVVSFLFFLIGKAAFLNSISFPPLQNFLGVIHALDEITFIMHGWLLLALLSFLSAILAFYKKEKYAFFPLAAWVIWLSAAIRILPLKINPATGKPGLWDITRDFWTLGPDLDPFLFLRWAKEIVSTGALYATDMMRYVPLGFNIKEELVLHVYLITWFHKLASAFGSGSIEFSAIIYPVFMFAITVGVFYLFVRKIFIDNLRNIKANLIALLSSFLFAVTPSILPRTVAGIPEKEASGFLFLFAAFYFFLSAWKSKEWKARYLQAILASASTVMMALVWGGYIYIYMTIALATGLAFLIGQADKQKFYIYTIWLFSSILVISWLTPRFSLYSLLTSTNTGIATAVFGAMLIYFIIEYEGIQKYIKRGFFKDMPIQAISIFIMVALAILASFFVGQTFLQDKMNGLVNQLVSPTTDRLGVTVAENRQPFFDEWASGFGPPLASFVQFITSNMISMSQEMGQRLSAPIFFWMFFLGSIYLFFFFMSSFNIKERLILTFGYSIFMLGIVFSRYRPDHALNGTNNISLFVYSLGFFALFFVLGYKGNEGDKKLGNYYRAAGASLFLLFLWLMYFKGSLIFMGIALISAAYFGILAISGLAKEENLKSVDWGALLLFSFFFLTIVSARGAVRLVMMLGPSTAIVVSAAVIILIASLYSRKYENRGLKIFLAVLAIIIILLTLFSMYAFYEGTKGASRSEVPYQYTFQWQKAMSWVRDNTPKDAVFGHWWDYGYWLQSIGERATVLDGGNAIPYWNHLMGRHALTGPDNQAALDYLYAHKTTHFLIDSTDIGKYSAFSSIGADIKGDRTSFIQSMSRNNAITQELKNGTKTFYFPSGIKYQNYMPFDEPIKYSDNGTNSTFEPRNSVIIGISVESDNAGKVKGQPKAIIITQGKGGQVETELPMKYAFFNNTFYEFESGIESGAFFMQRLNSQETSFQLEEDGALLYLSKRTVKSQLARLYLYKEDNPYFELAHSQDSPIVEQIKNSGAKEAEDIIFYGGVQGPIRIWEINYPDNMTLNQTYLSKNFPDARLAR